MGKKSKSISLGILSGCIKSIVFVQDAVASAWTLEKDTGYQSINVSYERGDFGRNWRQDSYFEAGVTQDWTVTGKVETVWREEANYNDRSSGEAGAKRRLWQSDTLSVAGQTTVFVGEKLDDLSCGGFGAEVGVAVGYSNKIGGRPIYAFSEVATGARQGCEHATLNAVIGFQPTEKWDLQVKAFSEQYPGREFFKLEMDISRKIGKQFVGIGVRNEVSGAFDETSAFMSIWRKF